MTYDIKLKKDAVSRYVSGDISIRRLASEIGVNGNTLWGWIRKARSQLAAPIGGGQKMMIDVTSAIKAPANQPSDAITLRINGVEVSTDSLGVKAIIEAIRQ
jgi:transposase-like protein